MKKVLCLILVFLMLPVTCFAFVACKDKGEDVKNFYTSYKQIADSTQNLTLVEANDTYQLNTNSYKIDIDYSNSSKLSTLVEDESTKYYYLKYFYQQLLDDSLAPLYFFGETISTNSKVSDKQTKELFDNLSTLKEDYENIDYYLGILITSLKATNDETVNLSYLKKLFVQYEQAITSAGNLSALVCNIYFNTVLPNSNFDYSSKIYTQLTDADLGSIAVNTRARLYYYKSVFANIYNQIYIRNNDLASQIVSTSTALPKYQPYTYFSTITSLESQAIETLRTNKQDIYNNIISLYNIQNNFDLAYQHFNLASDKIAYADLDSGSTTDELNYGKIMTEFVNGIAFDSYEILQNLVELLYL